MIAQFCQAVYDAIWLAGTPYIKHHLTKRVKIGKEDAGRLGERFGIASAARPAGRLIWLHGASVGESVALLTVVTKLRDQPQPPAVLVTTGTVTSAKIMAARLPEGCLHQFLPLDRRAWVNRFLDHWRPDGVIWSESEIWPRIFASLKERRIPLVMINLRMSARTVRNWGRVRTWMKSLLGHFSFVAAQTEIDKRNWENLGGPPATLLGNLKFVGPELPYDAEKLAVLHGEIGNRPLWVFSSIHTGEEVLGGQAQQELQRRVPAILTVIIPRHPHRGGEFAQALRAMGLVVAQRSREETVTPATQVYIADTMGEMGIFYRLGKIVAIGGSFVPHGGQNPIEPAKLKAAILYGPHMFNFTAICAAFEAGNAVRPVADGPALIANLSALLADPGACTHLGEAAARVAQVEADSLDKIWDRMGEWRARALA